MLRQVGVWVWPKACPPVPQITVWQELLSDLPGVYISDKADPRFDAALMPVSMCERFGCKTGSSEDTMGRMYVYDSHQFGPPSSWYPRFYISNAVWRKDPPFVEAVTYRLNELRRCVKEFNAATGGTIHSLWIDASVMGDWTDATEIDKRTAIRLIGELLSAMAAT